MATYKILQDVEAEDKILGSLTLKQFVFAFVAAAFLGVGWFIGGKTTFWMVAVFFIPAIPFIFLAAPIGKDQPNDVWLGAQLRFWFKPRIRRWAQSGISELVTITAPKKEEHVYTDGLSRGEVRSRLQTLANSLDYSGRLRSGISLPSPSATTSGAEPKAYTSNLQTTETAVNQNDQQMEEHFQSLIDNRAQANKELARIKMQSLASSSPPPVNEATAETEFLEKIHQRNQRLKGPTPNTNPTPPVEAPQPTVVAEAEARLNPAIIKQFSEADDLNVSTIATMAERAKSSRLLHSDEVIKLH